MVFRRKKQVKHSHSNMVLFDNDYYYQFTDPVMTINETYGRGRKIAVNQAYGTHDHTSSNVLVTDSPIYENVASISLDYIVC